jgi:hypothetical protein
VAADPTNAQLKRDLAVSYQRFAAIDASERRFEKARAALGLALKDVLPPSARRDR